MHELAGRRAEREEREQHQRLVQQFKHALYELNRSDAPRLLRYGHVRHEFLGLHQRLSEAA